MPEAPEVKLIIDSLQPVVNFSIKNIEINNNSKFAKHSDDHNSLTQLIEKLKNNNLIIKNITCKGKSIFFELNDGYLFNSLGMSGTWSFLPEKHWAIKLDIYKEKEEKQLYFNDVRHFGNFSYGDRDLYEAKIAALGPDMLSNPCSLSEFKKIALNSNKNICVWLLDQSNISGVGNYIKSEVLHRSKISPEITINLLNDDKLEKLYNNIINVMKESYQAGGTSLKDYKDANGRAGSFANQLQVYGKKIWNGYKVNRIKTPDGRSTFYCPDYLRNNI